MSLDHEYPYLANCYIEGKIVSVSVRLAPCSNFYLDSEENTIYLNEDYFVHREDGPAIEYIDSTDFSPNREWWLEGYEYTEEEFNDFLAKKKLKEALQSNLEEKEAKVQHKL